MAELEREGRRFAIATVVRTVGSTPQVVGAKLLVDDLGRLVGTLGGGCVEGDAFVEAKRVIETGDPSLREYELTEELAWDTGLVCGGAPWGPNQAPRGGRSPPSGASPGGAGATWAWRSPGAPRSWSRRSGSSRPGGSSRAASASAA